MELDFMEGFNYFNIIVDTLKETEGLGEREAQDKGFKVFATFLIENDIQLTNVPEGIDILTRVVEAMQ